jgi:hypothetical protein
VSVAEGVVDFGDGGAELGSVHTEVEIDGIEGESEVTGGGDEEVGLVGLGGREGGYGVVRRWGGRDRGGNRNRGG